MTLRDSNTRYAALKLIRDAVDEAMKHEKSDHLDELVADSENSGSQKWVVKVDDAPVASITLSARAAQPRISDESALIDAVSDEHPDWLEHTVSLKDWVRKQILESLVDVTDDGGVTKDGEVLPGISMSSPGDPYQSVRWVKSGGEETGKAAMAEAIRSGDLAELLAGTGLPLIGSAK